MKPFANFSALILFAFVSASCTERAPQAIDAKQALAINELVALRTEGLALAEIAAGHVHNPQVSQAIEGIKTYYRDTHPAFLDACRGQPIVLGQPDFDMIWAAAQDQMLATGQCAEETFLSLYIANTAEAIAIYERLLRAQEEEGLVYFALRALPGLYRQQNEFRAILRHKGYAGDTVNAALAK